jgi:creatinine amidohydrolase
MALERTIQLERLSWQEIPAAVQEAGAVAVLPVGAVEEHGPHLPLGTDSIETIEIARRAAAQARVVLVPPIWFGNSRGLLDFPGTIALRPETLKEVVNDVLACLIRHGFNRPVILDGHGGNYGILDLAAEDLHLDSGALVCHIRCWDLATLPKPEGVPPYDGHAGSSEISAMLRLCRADVHLDQFSDSKPQIEPTRFGSVFPGPSNMLSRGPVTIPLSMSEMVECGHHGDPRWASAERGEALLQVKAEALSDFLLALKSGQIVLRSNQKEPARR